MFPSLTSCRRRAALMSACSTIFSFSILAGLVSADASAAPITEVEALRYALSRPELGELARARLDEADADVLDVATWPNPTLAITRDKTGASTESSWQVAQPIDLSGRRGLRTEAAHHRRSAVYAENRQRAAERAGEVLRAFHLVLRQQDALRSIETWASRFERIESVVAKLTRAGETSGYDQRRLARERRAAEAELAEARAELERTRAKLSVLLGQPADHGVTGRLLPDLPDDLDTLQARLAQRPDLTALDARVAAANADNAAARRSFPEVTVGLGGKRIDDGAIQESGTMLSVSIPLPIFDRQQAGNRRSAAQAMAARADLALARRAAEGDLLGLHRQLTRLVDTAHRYRADAVGPSAELIRIAEAAYTAGESSLLELLDAYKGALEAETTAIALEWKAREASIELDQITGKLSQ